MSELRTFEVRSTNSKTVNSPPKLVGVLQKSEVHAHGIAKNVFLIWDSEIYTHSRHEYKVNSIIVQKPGIRGIGIMFDI